MPVFDYADWSDDQMKTPENQDKFIEKVTKMATDPMDVLMKKQQRLNQEMLKYSFELGRKLGYMNGYHQGEAKAPYDPNCTPEALAEFIQRTVQ